MLKTMNTSSFVCPIGLTCLFVCLWHPSSRTIEPIFFYSKGELVGNATATKSRFTHFFTKSSNFGHDSSWVFLLISRFNPTFCFPKLIFSIITFTSLLLIQISGSWQQLTDACIQIFVIKYSFYCCLSFIHLFHIFPQIEKLSN